MSSAGRPAHLEPSKLGTKEYWDNLYTAELSNHAADPSDIGTVWFDDSDAEAKMVEFLDDHAADSASLDPQTASLLDLGCGNGSLLFALRDASWAGRALGVDYSPQSVALARQVAHAREPSSSAAVDFAQWDLLRGALPDVLSGAQEDGFDVVLDKGTFDAVSLGAAAAGDGGVRPADGYRARALRLVRRGGVFLVTSCNWTEAELRAWFEGPPGEGGDGSGRFEVVGRVEYPSFSFGGVKGQTISTLCFRKL